MAIQPIEERERMNLLRENRYGKSRVRLVKVKRRAEEHDLREWAVEILLEGDFETCFVEGDNSKILPTDTMKNTVYSLARTSRAQCLEEFGKELVAFFLEGNPQVNAARVTLKEKAWEHVNVGGKLHPTTFVQSGSEQQVAEVSGVRGRQPTVRGGLEELVILKTAGSEFVGFIKDALTTLPEATDRLFGTVVGAQWKYSSSDLPFAALSCSVREILLRVFADHHSKSVQHTLYAMGEAVLNLVAEIEDIRLTMPNKHCLLVDLSRFGQDNPNEIFVPIDEPHGTIEARLQRQG
jgi:urate oxidase